MTKPYSFAFKQKMVQRLTGRNAVSASQLAPEAGIRQQNLSRWLEQARSLPFVPENVKPAPADKWTVERKAKILAEASILSGEELSAYLEREGAKLADYERWRIALEEGRRASESTSKRIRDLERELARKEKPLAEAAALLVLKKSGDLVRGGRGRRHGRDEREVILAPISDAQSSGADLASAQRWVARFVAWYNGEHRHSAIRYVTPDERHNGLERGVLARRHQLYRRARLANPERWSRATRN